MPAACVESSLHLRISAETIDTASHFKLPSSSAKNDKMPIRISALAFDLCVLYYRGPYSL